MDTDSQYDTILLEKADGLVRLTLNRPHRHNAMTHAMISEVYEALVEIARDDSVRVLHLTGAGRGFSPGGEAGQFDTEPEPEIPPEHYHVSTLLHDMPAVTVAGINGACAGAGMAWALACDLRTVTSSARFNTAFLDVAVASDMGLPWFLLRQVGGASARRLCLLPGKFDAEHARRLGLVDHVFEDEDFAKETQKVIDRLLRFAPPALKTLKANLLSAETMGLREFVSLETERHKHIRDSPEVVAAFQAGVARGSGAVPADHERQGVS